MFSPPADARLLLALMFLPAFLAAQETTGSISGRVHDPSGAIIPGATIEVSGTNLPRPILWTSDAAGNYLIPSVPIGAYRMKVSAPCFSTQQQGEVNVIIGRATRVDFTMQIGTTAESITVSTGGTAILQRIPLAQGLQHRGTLARVARRSQRGSQLLRPSSLARR